MRLLKILLVIVACAVAGPVIAEPFEDALAAHNIGSTYYYGRGVPQDYAQAAAWYRKAADQGEPSAQDALGIMYQRGHGVPQDDVQAHKWFNLAASRYRNNDKEKRDQAAKSRDEVAGGMTPAQISEAHQLASEWKPKEPNKPASDPLTTPTQR